MSMMTVAYVRHLVAGLSPAVICQLFYVFSAATVLAIAATPDSIQRLLMQYGARTSSNAPSSASYHDPGDNGRKVDSSVTKLSLRLIAPVTSAGKVPHSWFKHFYILSLTCTAFWAVQFVVRGSLVESIAKSQALKSSSSMTIDQVIFIWLLMGLQGARRLYEYLAVLRPSSSRMWIIHWLLGNAFYLCTSVSVWVEGSSSLLNYFDQDASYSRVPPLKLVVGIPLFFFAWITQYRCHRHLGSLPKYSLPNEGLFRYLICPHYTCECLIYLSMSVMAAPEGQYYNRTLACAVLFVLVNLGVTANGTKQWYYEKFGAIAQGRWKMIPFVF
ncbi:3-oxo-5-alpha-steroid 4-dehydrogenase [Poronia punctata]|nr:3-oxo-5-alpha-steroid 4-dehydrogenase [Poronia punctata]